MIGFIKKLWQRQRTWVIARAREDAPIIRQPRALCEHHTTGCYLCPREHCVGMLNDRDDPDPSKPRPSNSGHCVYTPGVNGRVGMRFNMTLDGAIECYKRQAHDQGYSDIRTRDMVMEAWKRIDAAASAPSPAPSPQEKRQARTGDVVW